MWLTLICANACLLCCGASLFFLQCMIVHVTEGIPLGGGMFYEALFPSRNGGNACLCPPVWMAEMHVLWVISFRAPRQCLQLGQLAVHTRVRPRRGHHGRVSKHLDHAPCPQSRLPDYSTLPPPRWFPRRRCVSVWKKREWSYLFVKWALDIINDKWSNCGSDDSSCKYWRKNLYNLILIIFLSFYINKWTAHAWVLGAQTRSHAPTALLELQGGRRQNEA